MAKKDKNEDEYKDNLDNSSAQDDEDFGLPDLDDDSTTDQPNQDEEVEIEITSEEELASKTITFDDDEPSDSFKEEPTDTDFVENTESEFRDEDDYELEEEEEGPVGAYVPPKQSSAPIIITLSIIVILACIAVYFFFIYESEPKVVTTPKVEKDTTSYVVEKPIEVEEPVIEEEPIKEEATINTLNVRSGRSYVVVGSFFDDDLAMDYAKELKSKGTTSYVIPPFGKSKFTRVAVKESSSFADASSMANDLAGQYKEQPWPLKY